MSRHLWMILLGWLLLAGGTVAAVEVPQVHFTVDKFVVEGENPFSEAKTLKLLEPFLGEHEGLDRIKEASELLENALHEKGYAFHQVVVPPQRAVDGVIKLKILTFPLGQIKINGNEHFSDENILRSLPPLRTGKTPNTLLLARSLTVANQHPAKRVAVFVRDGETPGKIDARIEASDMRPWQFFSSFANTGTRESGRTRASAGFQHSNLFNMDHVMTLSYTTCPDRAEDVRQYGIHYMLPLYRLGAGISVFYTHSKVDQGRVADFFQVSGKGSFAGISFDYGLMPYGDYNQKLTFGLQDRRFEDDVDFSGAPIGTDVRSRPFSLRYTGGWEKAKWNAGFYVEYARNLSWGNDNTGSAYAASRLGADRHWHLLRYGADCDYALPKNWRLRARIAGQETGEPLISGEQFGLGGVRSVRGFDEREVSGDSAQQFNLEVWTPPLFYNIRLLGFLDAGWLQFDKALTPGMPDREALASIGLGLRWQWKSNLSVSLDLACAVNGADTTDAGDGKLHFNIFFRF